MSTRPNSTQGVTWITDSLSLIDEELGVGGHGLAAELFLSAYLAKLPWRAIALLLIPPKCDLDHRLSLALCLEFSIAHS
jgi:hypothetical protein